MASCNFLGIFPQSSVQTKFLKIQELATNFYTEAHFESELACDSKYSCNAAKNW